MLGVLVAHAVGGFFDEVHDGWLDRRVVVEMWEGGVDGFGGLLMLMLMLMLTLEKMQKVWRLGSLSSWAGWGKAREGAGRDWRV